MPVAMPGMAMSMAMLRYNAFVASIAEQGPRGRSDFSAPNMFMLDVGRTLGARHYLNIDLMGTLEKWTFPNDGSPELLQIGEQNENGAPYVDAQHPHSSPLMGLTLSDAITLGEKNQLKVFIAPRGEATEGPVAFMHRPTGAVNPDVPLGHHIGQDVGHISSTVLGAALRAGDTTLEASTFNGTEPEPAKVDLPLAIPNSYAFRLTHRWTPRFYGMASAAYALNPEPHDLDLNHVWRYSISVYNDGGDLAGWTAHNAFIWGLVNFYDHASALNSFAEEAWLHRGSHDIWTRVEALERTADELQIASTAPNEPRWVGAATIGYAYALARAPGGEITLGASLTNDILPSEFRSAYGGDPWSAKIILRASGMTSWDL